MATSTRSGSFHCSARAIVALAIWLLAAPALAADAPEYSARYAVYRNGKLAGKAEFAFERDGDRWVIRNEAAGTHGMARLLHARDSEYAAGRMRDGRFWPDEFRHQTTVAGVDNRWSAAFDWEKRRVTTTKGQQRRELDLVSGALDGLSLKVEIQRRLRAGESDLRLHLVDDDEIKVQEFRQLAPERLETSLGCVETIPVQRVRSDSKRYTRAWHAPQFDYVAVRMEHGKTGGDHLEMRITELVLDRRAVPPRPGCSAHQSSP